MSWTTVCDLSMNEYSNDQVLDKTTYQNNALIIGGLSTHPGYVTFRQTDAQLEIPARDESLTRFIALRVQAFVRPRSIAHRLNIVEGWMSFAFFIESDGRLMGTVYDGSRWIGVKSRHEKVPPNRWSRVCFEYDGVSIAKLLINQRVVGMRMDLPYEIRAPQQVISIGHWPRGDGRYTFNGDIGHVRIERRDQEDIWRDALNLAYCRRTLSPGQIRARRELEYLLAGLAKTERQKLLKCSRRKLELLRKLMNKVRGNNLKVVAMLARIGQNLQKAWCCSLDEKAARKAMISFFHLLKQRLGEEETRKLLEDFLSLSKMCVEDGEPYNRIQELLNVIFPELRYWEYSLRQLLERS